MLICQRCNAELVSEVEARRHFSQAHAEDAPASLSLSGLTRAEVQMVTRVVERLRGGGDIVDRLRGRLKLALAEAAEYDGDRAEVAAIEAIA
jgi:hypothetical protein